MVQDIVLLVYNNFLNYGYDYNMVIKFTVKKNIRLIKDEIPIGDTVL